jgi:hypothetical protein
VYLSNFTAAAAAAAARETGTAQVLPFKTQSVAAASQWRLLCDQQMKTAPAAAEQQQGHMHMRQHALP